MKKAFRVEAVAGVATGVALEQVGSMAGIRQVMNHFYPGIMDGGMAAMQPVAAAEVYRQCPALRSFVDKHGEPDGYAADALDSYCRSLRMDIGEMVTLDGPIAVDLADAGRRVRDIATR